MTLSAAWAGALLIPFLVGCNEPNSGEKPVLPDTGADLDRDPLNPLNQDNDLVLNLQADLDSRFIQSLQIQTSDWSTTGAGQQIALTFVGSGMEGVRQFELVFEVQPAQFFDLHGSSFVQVDPFVTLGNGVEVLENGQGRSGAANLSGAASGEGPLGTLNLTTTGNFIVGSGQAYLRVRKFSLGPSSSDRDNFVDEQLNLGVFFE